MAELQLLGLYMHSFWLFNFTCTRVWHKYCSQFLRKISWS